MTTALQEEWYLDAKGHTRWRCNDEIAQKLKQLGDYLIIGGYEETHAVRYGRLAYMLSRHPELVSELYRTGRLAQLSGVGPTIAGIIGEFIKTGTCCKMEAWTKYVPKTVLELTTIPGLGVKTIRTLYQDYGVDSLEALRKALNSGRLAGGIGPKTVALVRQWLSDHSESAPSFPVSTFPVSKEKRKRVRQATPLQLPLLSFDER